MNLRIWLITEIVALAFSATAAHAGWGAAPVTITATTASIPAVEGCPDGSGGAFVAWQEASSFDAGVLRVHHILPRGDLDASWPASGAIASDVVAERAELVALPDRTGGVYLVWKEPDSLYATRIDEHGAIMAGWPSRGMSLDDVDDFYSGLRPSVIEDGAGGFYVAWQASYRAAVAHLGPSSTGTFGWPEMVRHYPAFFLQLALAPDGGVFLTMAQSGSWRLRRLQSDGFNSSGWQPEGISLLSSGQSTVTLSPDERGGVFLLVGSPGATHFETRLFRRQGDGAPAPDWPESGVPVPFGPYVFAGFHPDVAYRLVPDRQGGVMVGMGEEGVDNSTRLDLALCSPDASCRFAGSLWPPFGAEMVASGDGRFFSAVFHANGAQSPFDSDAFIQVSRCCDAAAPVLREEHPETGIRWYGDIALASTEDGGAVFFWSQVRDHVGLFARRFSPYGEVTWVKPRARRGLAIESMRFVPGEGVRATVSEPAGTAHFELFDLAGRRLASQRLEAGAREITIAGTSALPSGLYFGRLVAGEKTIAAKVIVARRH
jgi:hypothetical protein